MNSTVTKTSRLPPTLSAPLSLPLFDRSCHANCSRLAPSASSCHTPCSSRRDVAPIGEDERGGHLLVMTLPDSEAKKPTLTSTRVMRRPLLWRCSMTNMRSPAAPWTKSEEKRHHRNTQYHISARETSPHQLTFIHCIKKIPPSKTTGK